MTPLGTEVVLTADTWNRHILAKHSDLEGDQDCIRKTISNPEIINYDADRKNGECYYLRGAHSLKKYEHLFVKVCVKFVADDGCGWVLTAFLTQDEKTNEQRKWPKI